MTIAILDVHYMPVGARAACVVAESMSSCAPLATYVSVIEAVEDYEPGSFYRRELPCLLRVLDLLPTAADLLIIDGYVWLSDAGRPGLGSYLYRSIRERAPVIGVAKTAFRGAESGPKVVQVYRGNSKRPLFVTAAGIATAVAGTWVREMDGAYRVPTLLAAADRLARSGMYSDTLVSMSPAIGPDAWHTT